MDGEDQNEPKVLVFFLIRVLLLLYMFLGVRYPLHLRIPGTGPKRLGAPFFYFAFFFLTK